MPDLGWKDRAACRDADVNLFYSEDPDDVRTALRLCATCAVRKACYDLAMSHRDPFGVWGGTTERQRRRTFRADRQRRGRSTAA